MSDKEILNPTKESQEKVDQGDIQKAGQQKGEQLTGTAQASENFSQLGNQIETSIAQQELDKLFDGVDKNEVLQDPKDSNIVQKFVESIKSGNITQALQTFFDFVSGVLGKGGGPESTFWFRDNKEINDYLVRLSLHIDSLSLDKLKDQQKSFLEKIENTSGVKKKLGLTYALSRLLDQIVLKQDPSKSRLKGSSDQMGNLSANDLAIARMSQHIKPGDTLAINKSEKKTGDKLLTGLSSEDLDSSHVLIVTAVNPETGKITVAHSTQAMLNSPKTSGVELNVDLAQYTNQFNTVAIAALEPPAKVNRQELVSNVIEKGGKSYDKGAAVSTALTGKNHTANNDKYNCVELIAESFPNSVTSERRNRTHPSQMMKALKPSYVTIAGKSIGGS